MPKPDDVLYRLTDEDWKRLRAFVIDHAGSSVHTVSFDFTIGSLSVARALALQTRAREIATNLNVMQAGVLLHALGNGTNQPLGWRNHYAASNDGADAVLWLGLVSRGLARRGPNINGGDTLVFHATALGKVIAHEIQAAEYAEAEKQWCELDSAEVQRGADRDRFG